MRSLLFCHCDSQYLCAEENEDKRQVSDPLKSTLVGATGEQREGGWKQPISEAAVTESQLSQGQLRELADLVPGLPEQTLTVKLLHSHNERTIL